MDLSQAFDLTIKQFDLKASEISVSSGVAESDISKFRKGKQNIGYAKVNVLLKSLSPTARDYFWMIFNAEDSELPFCCQA